jgi:hypothetical protein
MGSSFLWLVLFAGFIIAILIGGLGLIILWKISNGSIDLSRLLSEQNGDTSLSRFQFLIFTFVIGMSLFLLVLANIDQGVIAFPPITSETLLLLGISGGTYAVSKGIQKSSEVAIQTAPTSQPIIAVTTDGPAVSAGSPGLAGPAGPRGPAGPAGVG